MATRISGGVGTTGVTKSFGTVGNGAFLHAKWEGGAIPNTSFSDGTDTWTLASYTRHPTSNEPGSALFYCLSVTSTASRTITPTFASGTPTFQHTEVEEWSPAASTTFALDGSVVTATGTGTGAAFHYNAVSATATAAGVAFFGVSDFNTLGTPISGGTPSFAVGNGGAPNGDSFLAYASVTGAGSVAPDITFSGGTTRWVQQLMLVKEVAAGGGGSAKRLLTLGVA